MSEYFYRNVSKHHMDKFVAVRDASDNLLNILQLCEIVSCSPNGFTRQRDDQFDIAIFKGEFNRAIIKKEDGYFSMTIPFNIIDEDDTIQFTCDELEENVSGKFISIMRNAIKTVKNVGHRHEDIILSLTNFFNLDLNEAIDYYDCFANLLSSEHGYFRFDDDPENENGKVHPRYHFDIFYKDNASLKIGYNKLAKLACITSLVDHSVEKKYLT